ncbi:MAG: hypothetical protein ACKVHP_24390 [Verrucomicrobiales bacterium]|jgi:hypothetical protein
MNGWEPSRHPGVGKSLWLRLLVGMVCIVVVGGSVVGFEMWRWLNSGWTPVYPVCDHFDGRDTLEGPMNPLFADNFEVQLQAIYGDGSVRRRDENYIDVRAPIAAFRDDQIRLRLTGTIARAMYEQFHERGRIAPQGPLPCQCVQPFAMMNSEPVVRTTGARHWFWGRWDYDDEWTSVINGVGAYKKPIFIRLPAWVWREDLSNIADVPRLNDLPKVCTSEMFP